MWRAAPYNFWLQIANLSTVWDIIEILLKFNSTSETHVRLLGSFFRRNRRLKQNSLFSEIVKTLKEVSSVTFLLLTALGFSLWYLCRDVGFTSEWVSPAVVIWLNKQICCPTSSPSGTLETEALAPSLPHAAVCATTTKRQIIGRCCSHVERERDEERHKAIR